MRSTDAGPAPVHTAPPPGADLTFADALHRAIEQQGSSLDRIRRQLADRGSPVSLATLSYWRSGRRRPEGLSSIEAVIQLEDLFDLPPGSLTDRLGPARRPGPAGRQLPIEELIQPGADVRSALGELGLDGASGLAEMSVHYTLDVDATARAHTLAVRALYRATRNGIDRKPIMLSLSEPVGLTVPVFAAVAGCTIGRQAYRADHGVFAAELLLQRPLRVGECVPVEYTVTVPETATGARYCEYNLVRRIREVMVWVRFTPDRVPSRVWAYRWLNGESGEWPVDVAGTSAFHHAVHGAGPGRVGLRWEW